VTIDRLGHVWNGWLIDCVDVLAVLIWVSLVVYCAGQNLCGLCA